MPLWHGFFLILGGAPRFYPNFTDKAPFFADLSVNFWPLWWGFTDKSGFLEHLSVIGIFRASLLRTKRPIFIDVSVNGSNFVKCSAALQLLNRCTWLRLRAKRCFLRFVRNLRPHCFGEGNWVEHFSKFWRFCSTFGSARIEFVGSGRTFFQFFKILFYSQGSAGRICRRR